MRVLVTGASGFVGRHLAKNLKEHGHDLFLTAPDTDSILIDGQPHPVYLCDITSPDAVEKMVKALGPDAIIHLAGVAHVPSANSNRENLVRINILGTRNICAAVNSLPNISFLLASTALVYDLSPGAETRLDETCKTSPNSAYGFSKLAAENICLTYASENFRVFIARPFNHTGPGQTTEFVCPALAQRIALCGNGETIEVGNLSARRDFTDVRDIVDAYRLIIEKAPDQKMFVLGSGQAIAISEVLERLIAISGKKIRTTTASGLLRKEDPALVLANPALAEKLLGWQRKHPIDQTLKHIYSSFL